MQFGKVLFLAIVLIGLEAKAISFGTRFACCVPEATSCLGGGGGMIWHRTLADRALTQVDAQARCGFHQMQWNTHSCPANKDCDDTPLNLPPAHSQTRPVEAPPQTITHNVCNYLRERISVSIGLRSPKRETVYTYGWWNLEPGECKPIAHKDFFAHYLYYIVGKGASGTFYQPDWTQRPEGLANMPEACVLYGQVFNELTLAKCRKQGGGEAGYEYPRFGFFYSNQNMIFQ